MISTSMNDKIYKGVAIILFSFMFIYLLLRIIFNEPLHDEVATYMFYIYHGDYMGETIHWDANNHLLNSFVCHQLYKLFGDHMFVFRIPNLLTFVLYFFGTIQLTKSLKTPLLKTTALLALNTIPFIMEYFGNTRGYGMSFGFLVWGLVFFNRFLVDRKLLHLFYTYLFLILTISANLTLINSCIIITGTAVISSFFMPDYGRKKHLKEWALHIGFMLALLPFVRFIFQLRVGEALYYGSLKGFWEVTAKTLSKYTLFYDENWLQFAYLIILAIFIVSLFLYLKKTKKTEWFHHPKLTYALLFFGNICAIFATAFLLEVNYPEDRVGMYLVLFFLLIFFHFLDEIRFGKWIQFTLIFFPISLLMNLSLHSSVFSPDDRLNQEFYKKIKAELTPESTLHIYRMFNWGWPYAESHVDEKSSVGLFDNANSTLSDILITKSAVLTNPKIVELYDTIAYYEPSTHIAFKRKVPLKRDSLITLIGTDMKSNGEFFDFATIDSRPYAKKNLVFSVSGHLKTVKKFNKLILVVSSQSTDGASRYLYYSFETAYQGQLIDNDFLHNFVIENVDPSETEFKIYLWNRNLHPTQISNISTTIYQLKE